MASVINILHKGIKYSATWFDILTTNSSSSIVYRKSSWTELYTNLVALLRTSEKCNTFNLLVTFLAHRSKLLPVGIKCELLCVADFVNPFGGVNSSPVDVMFTFYLDTDTFQIFNSQGRLDYSLSQARSGRLPNISDSQFNLFELPWTLPDTPSPFGNFVDFGIESDIFQVTFDISREYFRLGSRLLRDFYSTWRHLFRVSLSDKTFLQICRALISICRMNFDILEILDYSSAPLSLSFATVKPMDLPTWQGLQSPLFVVNDFIRVLMTQNLSLSRHLVEDDIRDYCKSRESLPHEISYLVMSLEHFYILKFNTHTQLVIRSPVRQFMNGYNDLREQALFDFLTILSVPDHPGVVLENPDHIQPESLLNNATDKIHSNLGYLCKLFKLYGGEQSPPNFNFPWESKPGAKFGSYVHCSFSLNGHYLGLTYNSPFLKVSTSINS